MNAPFAMAPTRGATTSSATMAAMIDAEVQRILNEGRAMARALLSEHHDQLTKLADALMEHEGLEPTEYLFCLCRRRRHKQLPWQSSEIRKTW